MGTSQCSHYHPTVRGVNRLPIPCYWFPCTEGTMIQYQGSIPDYKLATCKHILYHPSRGYLAKGGGHE